jgi:hypothetical protein
MCGGFACALDREQWGRPRVALTAFKQCPQAILATLTAGDGAMSDDRVHARRHCHAMDMASVGWRGDGARTCTTGSVAAVAVDRSSVRRKMVLRTMQ